MVGPSLSLSLAVPVFNLEEFEALLMMEYFFCRASKKSKENQAFAMEEVRV